MSSPPWRGALRARADETVLAHKRRADSRLTAATVAAWCDEEYRRLPRAALRGPRGVGNSTTKIGWCPVTARDSICPRCGAAAYPHEMCSRCFQASVSTSASTPALGDRVDTSYADFLARKQLLAPMSGIANPDPVSSYLWKWQAAIVRWALKRGKAAIFADTGLGKGIMTLEWARAVCNHTKRPVLILAPLAVAQQFVREAEKLYGDRAPGDSASLATVRFVADQGAVDANERDIAPFDPTALYVTNYQKLHKFDSAAYAGVALDESGILKSFDGATRTALIDAFRETPFRLCGTATPSPNDHTELGNTCEFLGIMTRAEMLAEFFTHDGGRTSDWRLKNHGIDAFWRFVASWACAVRRPSDLGFPNEGYDLPPLRHHAHELAVTATFADGSLFVEAAAGIQEQRAARRRSMDKRVEKAIEIARAYVADGHRVLVWCELNDEQEALAKKFGVKAYSVAGKDSDDAKESAILGWLDGKRPVMLSKGSIMGHGLNFQVCSKVIFVGATNSFEMYYQAIRRCWRYGQTQPVDVHVIYSDAEGRVLENLERKQLAAAEMGAEMAQHVSAILREELTQESSRMENDYDPRVEMVVPQWCTSDADADADADARES